MKFATILSIAFIAVPTLAMSTEQYERSYDVAESDVYGREAADEIVDQLTREELDDILGRELVDDIEERSPFIFGAIKAAVKVGRVVAKAVQARKNRNKRELEFDERDLEFDEDLEMREPRFGGALKLFRGASKAANRGQQAYSAYQQNSQREFDEEEMFEREFDDEESFEREFNDLD